MPYSSRIRLKPHQARPLQDINTTPLIDVMLVLLIMMIITIPLPHHSLDIDLPQAGQPPPDLPLLRINKVVVTTDGRTLWNGSPVDEAELASLVAATTRMPEEPQLHFEPEATAGYEESAEAIRVIKEAGATRFAFVGNQRYSSFER